MVGVSNKVASEWKYMVGVSNKVASVWKHKAGVSYKVYCLSLTLTCVSGMMGLASGAEL